MFFVFCVPCILEIPFFREQKKSCFCCFSYCLENKKYIFTLHVSQISYLCSHLLYSLGFCVKIVNEVGIIEKIWISQNQMVRACLVAVFENCSGKQFFRTVFGVFRKKKKNCVWELNFGKQFLF